MRLKNSYFYTIREDIKEEETNSGSLLVRSGMIRKNSAGIYMFLPLGYKVLKNIEQIVREEMNNTGALEVLMPSLVYEDYYIKSGRKEKFGPSVFALNDRFNKPYVLGPTHEELFAIAASYKIKSYKDLPFNLYQFQNKFRDEARPRFGLIRVREFIMKDAYSFDKDKEGLEEAYQKMFKAYQRAFERMNLEYKVVTADTGIMGGLLSEEFQAVTDIGEDTLVLCEKCTFASNLEIAPLTGVIEDVGKKLSFEEFHTPNCKTIEDLGHSYPKYKDKLVKALMFNADGKICFCFIPGDREVNITKLGKLTNTNELVMASEEEILNSSNTIPGFTGPVGLELKNDAIIVVDESILKMRNFIVGANKKDYHLLNVNIDDFKHDFVGDISLVKEGDICPECGNKFVFKKGIEIGNTFKLGTKYAESYNVKYMDQNNELQPVWMGSYGIGIGRCMAAIVEQSHDDKGIIWPMNVSPYKVAIVLIDPTDEIQNKLANKIYNELTNNNIDTILDDRDERVGVKFNDMDLIGIPLRITVGKKASDDVVELKYRNSQEMNEIKFDEILKNVNKNS